MTSTDPTIAIINAVAYRSAGRRFFSKEAAIHRMAYRLCMEEANCDCSGEGACAFHALDTDERHKAVAAKEAMVRFVDLRSQS